jgi:hypothetical protein
LKKKILLFLSIVCITLCLAGCQGQNKHDRIEVWNKGDLIFDDINIDIKEGYFYKKHEKFTVDKNTIGVTIYFSTEEADTWDD